MNMLNTTFLFLLHSTTFLCKNLVHKNVETEILAKIVNTLKTLRHTRNIKNSKNALNLK